MSTTLSTEGISKRFGGLVAVRDVSIKIRPGERVGLLGPNGAGKTTLTNLLCGDLKASTGRIYLGDTEITRFPAYRRFRMGLARTYQVANPFPSLSVRDAVAVGALASASNVAAALEAADATLALLGLESRGACLMSELTIVEMKLVELARLLAAHAQVLILDELLAGLRPDEIAGVLEVVSKVTSDGRMTVIMIEHIVSVVTQFCERLIVMKDGAVIADGPLASVISDPHVIEAYLGSRGRDNA